MVFKNKKFLNPFLLKLYFFLALYLSPATAQALITIIRFDEKTFSRGEGKLFNNNNTSNSHIIYGGYSGVCRTSDLKSDSVCNSCGTHTDFPCNQRRIHDNLIFTLYFRTTEAGPILITTDSDDNQIVLENVFGPVGDLQANSEVRIGIRWQQICQQIFGGTSCNESEDLNTATLGIRIGIDSNRDGKFHSNTASEYSTEVRLAVLKIHDSENCDTEDCNNGINPLCFSETRSEEPTGVCNFKIYPGDQKVYIDEIRGDCRFPSVEKTQAKAIRVFYTDSEDGHPNIIVSGFKDLNLTENSSSCKNASKLIGVTQNQVSGLTNGQEYRFRIGVVDRADNVGFVTSYEDINNCFEKEDTESECHSAIPGPVVGLIENGSDCFIATATYGWSHPKVKTFLRFRDQFLKTSSPGLFLIKIYYYYSPFLAKWTHEHPKSRFFWKILLWPLWFFAKICLDWSFQTLGVLFFFLLFINLRKRKKTLPY